MRAVLMRRLPIKRLSRRTEKKLQNVFVFLEVDEKKTANFILLLGKVTV